MKLLLVATGAALLCLPAAATAQGRITNAKTETRSGAAGIAREVQAIASRGVAAWIGYRAPLVSGPRQMCCSDNFGDSGACCGRCRLEGGSGVTMNQGESRVALEPPSEFLILARVDTSVTRVRTFTPDCDIDAGGMPLVWLDGVRAEDSLAWLASLVTSAPDSGEAHDRVAKPAIAAIALHNAEAADRTLETFVAPSRPEWLRGDTAFWLGTARGAAGARLLARMMKQDASDRVRDKVAFGLSVSKDPSALPTLIDAARNDKSAHVRGQALFWLAHKAGQKAVETITGAIANDPETEVKKKAVFALSQLPKDEGVPMLIDVARSNKNPEVRKQAMFWLGQSHDPRAVQFFEQVLTAK
jgi:HEAT repeat protein